MTIDYVNALIDCKNMAPRPNLTGFDIKKLAASSNSPANDPWARRYTRLS